MEHAGLLLFNHITSSDAVVEIDERWQSALATFTVDGQERWSMSIWLDGHVMDGFVLRDVATRVELVVRDLAVLDIEPVLAWAAQEACRAGGLSLPPRSDDGNMN